MCYRDRKRLIARGLMISERAEILRSAQLLVPFLALPVVCGALWLALRPQSAVGGTALLVTGGAAMAWYLTAGAISARRSCGFVVRRELARVMRVFWPAQVRLSPQTPKGLILAQNGNRAPAYRRRDRAPGAGPSGPPLRRAAQDLASISASLWAAAVASASIWARSVRSRSAAMPAPECRSGNWTRTGPSNPPARPRMKVAAISTFCRCPCW